MQRNGSRLTVYFDTPFWVGMYERFDETGLSVSKIVFGAEPKDYEVYDYLLKHWSDLRFSPPVSGEIREERRANPKRMQRIVKKQIETCDPGTKAQKAFQQSCEMEKSERKKEQKEKKREKKEQAFALRQKKRKKRKRGR